MNAALPLRRAALLATCLLPLLACVSPDALDTVQQGCPEGTFDSPSREHYCSGTITRTVQALELPPQPLLTGVKTLTYQDQGGLLLAQQSRAGNIQVFRLAKSELGGTRPAKLQVEEAPPDSVDWKSVERFASFGLPDFAKLGVTADPKRAMAVFAMRDNSIQTIPLAAPMKFDGVPDRPRKDKSDDAGDSEAPSVSLIGELDCELESGVPLIESFTPFYSVRMEMRPDAKGDWDRRPSERRFMALSTPCGAIVVGRGDREDETTQVLARLPLDARDMQIDPTLRRVFIAGGRDGLRVRLIGSLFPEMEDVYDGFFPPDDVEPSYRGDCMDDGSCDASPCEEGMACVGATPCEDGTDCEGDNPELTPEPTITPIFDTEGAAQVLDPSSTGFVNVTRVNFFEDRVFFINRALSDADDESTTLVAAGMSPANTLETRAALKLERPMDLDLAQTSYRIAPVSRDAMVLVREQRDGDALHLAATLYDAPNGRAPVEAAEIPIGADALSVLSEGSQVSVVYPDRVEIFTIQLDDAVR